MKIEVNDPATPQPVRVQRQVAADIEKHGLTPRGEKLLLALSGGRDSVCLVDIFQALRAWGGWALTAVHFDHGLRGSDASAEETVCCQTLCRNLQIPLHVETLYIAPEPGESLETAARNARLTALRRLSAEWNIHHIATAHQANDRIETVLFRMLRGTGLRGLAGIEWRRVELLERASPAAATPLTFHRPLLGIWREEITEYCGLRGLSYINDPTNDSDDFDRNVIRHQLLPGLDGFNPEARYHLWALAQDAEDWQRQEPGSGTTESEAGPGASASTVSAEEFPFDALPWTLDGATLLTLGRVRAVSALQTILETARRRHHSEGAPSRKHYDALWAMLRDANAPVALDLPAGWRVRRQGSPPHARLTLDRSDPAL